MSHLLVSRAVWKLKLYNHIYLSFKREQFVMHHTLTNLTMLASALYLLKPCGLAGFQALASEKISKRLESIISNSVKPEPILLLQYPAGHVRASESNFYYSRAACHLRSEP